MFDFNDTTVRILKIDLKNYKNICNGSVPMSKVSNIEDGLGDILGIYGQNGSGKTSVINAISLIKNIVSGRTLPKDTNEYITFSKNETEINTIFYIKKNKTRYKVKLNIIISKGDEHAFIKKESIEYWHKLNSNDDWDRKKALLINNYDNNSISPKYRNEELLGLYNDENDFIVNKKMKFRDRKSFIFSGELLNLINVNKATIAPEYEILNILHHYVVSNLFIIDNKELALSDANILLPMNFKNYSDDKYISMGVMPIGLDESTYMPKVAVEVIETSLIASNKVINEIIPGLTIKLNQLKIQTSKSGEEEVLVELFSCRDETMIPIKYESDGIKKIVAVIHLLISMFNHESMTVLIDELDSGIFEYLLGEILEILEQRGKGQLVFTSHNLRPLEVLDKNNLIFTTTNTDNRFIKLKNVKSNNNIRDVYYRDVVLGGQYEVIYNKTNSAKIARAFRKAGELPWPEKR